MKCPKEKCDHEFSETDFAADDPCKCLVCPICESKVMAKWEKDQHEVSFIWELEIV